MPAREETWRNLQKEHAVFAITSLAMLAAIVWMMADDHLREWKQYQRQFRQLETEQIAQQIQEQREKLNIEKKQELEQRIGQAEQNIQSHRDKIVQLESEIRRLRGREQAADQRLRFEKANLQAARSRYDLAVRDGASASALDRLLEESRRITERVEQYQRQWEQAKADLDAAQEQLAQLTEQRDTAQEELKQLESDLARLEESLQQVRLTSGKRVLTWPILDAFNSPLKIETTWLPDLKQPIGSFGEVARFDRCTTCHLAIDRTAPGSAAEPGWPPKTSPDDSAGYEQPFVTHPRLELYVGSSSPHPKQEFGCTACHEGQGSDTSFVFASHTPNTIGQAKEWKHGHGWYENHYWEYPQWPRRFLEASCIRCHHSVTELEHSERFGASAPKVVNGYHLVRNYGCFGCHEINGYEEGRPIGPDLRLEPPTPDALARSISELENLLQRAPAPTPAGVDALVEANRDPTQITGTLRKVGPSLVRLAEKTAPDWTYRWIKDPRAFRPDTRMPHFFGLYNSGGDPEELDELQSALEAGTLGTLEAEAAQQRIETWRLAHTEIHAMTHYLFRESENYLDVAAAANEADPSALRIQADQLRGQLDALKIQLADPSLSASEKQQLTKERDSVIQQLAQREQTLAYRDVPMLADASPAGDAEQGRLLFLQKGCLACHSHRAFPTAEYHEADADFGPDLSDLSAKLRDGEEGRRWLFNWLRNPRIHHPRGYMPNLFLSEQEATDIAAWLLSQPGQWQQQVEMPPVDDQEPLDPQAPPGDPEARSPLDYLVFLYLTKAVPLIDAEQYLRDNQGIPSEKAKDLKGDESLLVGPLDTEKKLAYLGRKTISRYGCFGCHDIPGFETAKPIGTGLNDWGAKDRDMIAFERVNEYLQDVHHAEHTAEDDPDFAFYYEAILGHKRHGFIWQKLHEPRSFDYPKLDLTIKPYEDRLRMPQFRFATTEEQNDQSIEAIATFVLGLVANPPTHRYVYQPDDRQKTRLAGLELVTRFNCVGCHIFETPAFTFQVDPQLHEVTPGVLHQRATDYRFHAPQFSHEVMEQSRRSETATIHGLVMGGDEPDLDEATELYVDLWQPTLVMGQPWRVGEQIIVPKEGLVSQTPAFGGNFAQLLVDALVQRESRPDFQFAQAWPMVPPPLVREGQKVQTAWLYQFLLNPTPIRPAVVLRMPHFNVSPDEARTLAEYFAAEDEATAYPSLVETAPAYLQRHESQHQARAGPDRSYLQDAYRLLTNQQLCVQCHQVGGLTPAGKPEERGPDLTGAPQRFRPEWLLTWLGNPKRVLPYTGMPQNFPNGRREFQNVFPGTSLEQVTAVRDVLLNYHKILESQLAEGPSARSAAPGPGGQ